MVHRMTGSVFRSIDVWMVACYSVDEIQRSESSLLKILKLIAVTQEFPRSASFKKSTRNAHFEQHLRCIKIQEIFPQITS